MKASAVRDMTVSGPNLAAEAFIAGLVDECQLFVAPILAGDGRSAFPSGVRLPFVLGEERRFANGMVYLHYRSATSQAA